MGLLSRLSSIAQQLVSEHAWEVTKVFRDGFPAFSVGGYSGVPSLGTRMFWAHRIDQCEGFLSVRRNH